jgi:hypothetical protein
MTMPRKRIDGFDSLRGTPTAEGIALQTGLVAQFATSPPDRRPARYRPTSDFEKMSFPGTR